MSSKPEFKNQNHNSGTNVNILDSKLNTWDQIQKVKIEARILEWKQKSEITVFKARFMDAS